MATKDEDVDGVLKDWSDAVTMTPPELERWLDTDESRSVGTGGRG